MTKSTKSHLRGFSILLKIFFRVHELVARSSAWRVRAANDRAKVGSFAALHGFSYTTRANIAHEEAEQIRARIVCTPARKRWAGINTYAKHVCWRRRDGASWIERKRWRDGARCFHLSQGSYKTGNFAHVEKRWKIINSLWKRLLKTLIYNGFRILLFQGGKKTLFLNFYKNHRKTRHFSLFPIKRENLH